MRSLKLLAVLAVTALMLTGSTVATANPTAPQIPDGAIPLGDGAYALELKKDTPGWYTDELHRRVVAAGTEGVPLPASADIDTSLLFTGIRPGSWMIFPSWCTMNFVFGSEGNYYIGTAGHCAEVGDEVTLIAAPGVLMNIGRTVKSFDQGIGRDFALVEVYPEMQEYVNPSMSYFGGPTGTEQPAIGDPILHSGHGLVIGTGGTPRAGVVTYVGDGDVEGGGSDGGNGGKGNGGKGNGKGKKQRSAQAARAAQIHSVLSGLNTAGSAYGWDGAAIFGDSGSAVRKATGAAAGNLTHLVVGSEYLPAFIAGTTAPALEQLAGMPITTAPPIPDPLW